MEPTIIYSAAFLDGMIDIYQIDETNVTMIIHGPQIRSELHALCGKIGLATIPELLGVAESAYICHVHQDLIVRIANGERLQ